MMPCLRGRRGIGNLNHFKYEKEMSLTQHVKLQPNKPLRILEVATYSLYKRKTLIGPNINIHWYEI